MTDGMSLGRQQAGQLAGTLTGPSERGHGIASGIRVNQSFQRLDQLGVVLDQRLPSSSRVPYSLNGERWLSKALDSPIDGRTRESGKTGDAGNTPSSQLLCIDGSDKVLLSLIQVRKQQAVFLLKFFCCAHTDSVTQCASFVTIINLRALSRAILSPNHRVVGVVINAIDDRLASAQQIRDDWTINRIGPLGSLLKLARDSGRVVILASDHGHVWHRPDARNVPLETGGRWRPKSQDLAEDEITLSGRRVKDDVGGNSITVPWSERVFYGRQQNGYHGGATLQEMVCPLVLLKDRSSAYSGLFDCEHPKPDWWSSAPVRTVVRSETPALVEVTSPKRQPTLFDNLREEPVEPEPQTTAPREWIGKLFASQVYKSQKELIRRHAPEDSIVRQTLTVLESSGGLMTPTAFSNAASIPAARLDGLIALIQRLLNVDGYEILTLNRTENKIELNLARLKRQFDLD